MLVLWAMVSSCAHPHGPNTHTHEAADAAHDHGDGAHNHGALEPLSYTLWNDKTELFVEFPPLIVGKSSRFAAHFSNMANFKAITEGKLIVRLFKGNQKIAEHGVAAPSSPGIFRPFLSPTQAGTYHLEFVLMSDEVQDTVIIEPIEVYADEHAAMEAAQAPDTGDEISFLKEQAWKIDFAIEQAKQQPIREVIHSSGQIKAAKGAEKMIVAKSSGLVFFKNKKLEVGRDVQAGETLFSISSNGLLQSNVGEKYQVAKAHFDKTKANFERAEELLSQQIIGQKEYEQRKMDYTVAQAEFETLNAVYNAKGQNVQAPIMGIVKNVLVSDGQYVAEGTPLAELTTNRRLLLEAEVSQAYLPQVRHISTAHFKTPYQQEVQSLADYNGRLISFGKMIEEGSNFIPVSFELDNLHDLVAGSFVELFLLGQPQTQGIVIPKSALMQDYNQFYVYVQTAGESFEKRNLRLGIDDGKQVQVLEGLKAGEWLVTKGAYQIKMASMSSAIPAHGHEH